MKRGIPVAAAQNMTEGRPWRLIAGFAVPLMLGNLFQAAYTLADSVIAGRLLGMEAFAAVGMSGTYYWLLLSVILGLSQGFGTLLAQYFGSGDMDKLRRGFATAMALTLAFGCAFSIAGGLITKPALTWLNTPADIFDSAANYLHLLVGGLFLTFFYNFLASTLRAIGDSRTPLEAMLLAAALNVAGDILLLRYTSLGVSAVALATLFAQAFASVYCFVKLCSLKELGLFSGGWRYERLLIMELLRLGTPLGFRNCIIALGGIAMQYVINGYGTVFVAGIAAPKKLFGFMEVIGGAVDGAIATFVAQNYGAKQLDRIRQGMKAGLGMMLAGSLLIGVVFWFFGQSILGLMVSGEEGQIAAMLEVAQTQLKAMVVCLPSLYLLFLYRSGLQGMGNTVMPMLSGFLELFIRLLFVLALPGTLGAWAVYGAEPVGWIVAGVQLGIAYKITFAREIRYTNREPSLRDL